MPWDVDGGGQGADDFVRHCVIMCVGRVIDAGKGVVGGGRREEAKRNLFLCNNASYLIKGLGEEREGLTVVDGSDEEEVRDGNVVRQLA